MAEVGGHSRWAGGLAVVAWRAGEQAADSVPQTGLPLLLSAHPLYLLRRKLHATLSMSTFQRFSGLFVANEAGIHELYPLFASTAATIPT